VSDKHRLHVVWLPYNYDTPREDVAVVLYLKAQVFGRGFQVLL